MRLIYQRYFKLKPCLIILFPSNLKKGKKLWKKEEANAENKLKETEKKEEGNTEISKSQKETLGKKQPNFEKGEVSSYIKKEILTPQTLWFWISVLIIDVIEDGY